MLQPPPGIIVVKSHPSRAIMHSDTSEPDELEPVAIVTEFHPGIELINDTFQPFQYQLPARSHNNSSIPKPPKTEAVSLLKSLSVMANLTSTEGDISPENDDIFPENNEVGTCFNVLLG